MAITEFAHMTLKHGLTSTDPNIRANLQDMRRIVEKYNNLPVRFFSQIDDPTIMVVLAAWESQAQHQHGFNGSATQNQILELVRNQLSFDWMHYMDIEQKSIPTDAPVLAVVKQTTPRADHTDGDWDSARAVTGAGHGAVTAWNLSKDPQEADVRVSFSGWESMDEAKTALARVDTTSKDVGVMFFEQVSV